MMRQSLPALRGVALAALVLTTVTVGSLRDALVYVPNGAEVDHGATGTTATVPKK